jgi:hypothetical protein
MPRVAQRLSPHASPQAFPLAWPSSHARSLPPLAFGLLGGPTASAWGAESSPGWCGQGGCPAAAAIRWGPPVSSSNRPCSSPSPHDAHFSLPPTRFARPTLPSLLPIAQPRKPLPPSPSVPSLLPEVSLPRSPSSPSPSSLCPWRAVPRLRSGAATRSVAPALARSAAMAFGWRATHGPRARRARVHGAARPPAGRARGLPARGHDAARPLRDARHGPWHGAPSGATLAACARHARRSSLSGAACPRHGAPARGTTSSPLAARSVACARLGPRRGLFAARLRGLLAMAPTRPSRGAPGPGKCSLARG